MSAKEKSFTSHATLIGGVTFLSRLLGAARESVTAHAFGGSSDIFGAFTVAFTVPNLFRKLLGEGALSSAFIPLYTQARKREETAAQSSTDGALRTTHSALSSKDFAVASVNLLSMILIGLTLIGEVVLLALYFLVSRPDYLLAVKLSAIMLPYVLLVCGTAFLGSILQVHSRFTAITLTSVVLNAILIVFIIAAGRSFNLTTPAGQTAGVYLLSVGVLLAGLVQILILIPSLRAIGFQFRPVLHVFTPEVKQMLTYSLPLALSAAVLQIGVMLDKGIALVLAEGGGKSSFILFGHTIAYPMAEGATTRLNWAQFMYQFPLGVFAIAIATAIFPKLAGDALGDDKTAFRNILRRGITASLFIGLPASVGMCMVAGPAVRLLFRHGKFTETEAQLVILSTIIYSAAIWAFSILQILNKAYYALHDMKTPLLWGVINLALNLIIEIPLLWSPLHESAMAVGTLVSFAIQAVFMTWALNRRLGGIGLRAELKPIAVMTAGSIFLGLACYTLMQTRLYPTGQDRLTWALQLTLLMITGIWAYTATCLTGGLDIFAFLRRKRAATPANPTPAADDDGAAPTDSAT